MSSTPAGPDRTPVSESPVTRYLRALHDKYARLEDGDVATYIPELGRARPDWFGIAVATTDGQVYEVGDSRVPFTIQSISKPFVYGLALEARGLKTVLGKVGVEPSGEAFNSISLDPRTGRPLNPMINAGAIATSGLVPGATAEERQAHLLGRFSEFAGRDLPLDEAVYRSERDTGHRNRAISHLLRNFDILEGDPEGPLDLYFRQCSISVTARDLAVMAAGLATGGTNPVTGRRVLAPVNVGRLLSIMSSCGMYDAAGEWIYNIGMPAKSGVAGGILAVLPGQLGIGVFSPPLDAKGNSVRGIRVCADLSTDFGLHLFNTPRVVTPALRGIHTATSLRSKRLRTRADLAVLAREGQRIRLYELRGRLVFASLEIALRSILADVAPASLVILDLGRVLDIDRASSRLLLELSDSLSAQGRRVLFTGTAGHPGLRAYAVARLSEDGWNRLCPFPDREDALEAGENELLARHGGECSTPGREVPLARHELLADLGPDELAALASRLVDRVLEPGEIAFTAGSHADALFLVLEGEVGIFIGDGTETGQLVSRIGPGMAFGEVALLDRAPRSATVRALGRVRTRVLGFADYDRLPADGLAGVQTKILANLARVLAARLRGANAEIRSLKV